MSEKGQKGTFWGGRNMYLYMNGGYTMYIVVYLGFVPLIAYMYAYTSQ